MDNMDMENEVLASQLRKPEGELGKEVAEQMNIYNKFINLRTIDLLKISNRDKVLEIGMGNGLFCKDILSKNHSVSYIGCDYSEIMARDAFARNQEFVVKDRADFFMTEAANLPFPDNYFTKIFTVNTLYFWKNPLAELHETMRVLAPGGLAIISIRTKSTMQDMPVVQYGFNLFEKEDLLTLLEQSKFARVEVLQEKDPEMLTEDRKINFESIYGLCWK